jgi:hypothetical protein
MADRIGAFGYLLSVLRKNHPEERKDGRLKRFRV